MLSLNRSALDPDLWEVVEGGAIISEIPILFKIYKMPRSFPSLESLQEWLKKEEKRLAKQVACRLLMARGYSTTGLKQKLERKRFSDAVCDILIEELKELGYLKDDEFTERLILKEALAYGPRYIEMKLRSRGLSAHSVRQKVSPAMQIEAIRRLLPKLRGNPAAALQRRGFDLDLIRAALKNT
ncbi:MAG: regulatory protein RecX [Chlamydiia bacterium]|nr:regulatory protein RecX [Chlamydiia bacterium]